MVVLHPALTPIWVVGTFLDLTGNPLPGPVTLTPKPRVLIDREGEIVFTATTFTARPDHVGYFQVQVPATTDPAITPTGWAYTVTEPTGRRYPIVAPHDTPILDEPGHPLHGHRVLDLADVVPTPGAGGGVGQLLRGRGVQSMRIVTGDLVVTYTDGVIDNAGPIPTSGGGGGDGAADRIEFQRLAATTVSRSGFDGDLVLTLRRAAGR